MEGKEERIAASGLAVGTSGYMRPEQAAEAVPCPLCGSEQTVETSHFGSTACKALYRCLSCREPFDYFKPY